MPIPFSLDHVNLWALRDGEGWTVIDTGVADDSTRAVWQQVVEQGLGGRPVTRLICTHSHPDHMELAGWFSHGFGIPLTATAGEWQEAQTEWHGITAEAVARRVEHYRRAGYGSDLLDQVRQRASAPRRALGSPPTSVEALCDGDCLDIGGRRWQVMTCGGHSPEHACLWSAGDGILISGDQILPRISPVVGVWSDAPDADPLSLFLGALDRLAELPDGTLVLPSHERPFRGLQRRCHSLHHHHQHRLKKVLDACAQPCTALGVQQAVFRRPLDARQVSLATGEMLAHLNHLTAKDLVRRDITGGGVWTYQAL